MPVMAGTCRAGYYRTDATCPEDWRAFTPHAGNRDGTIMQ
jgi:hypothetical protein